MLEKNSLIADNVYYHYFREMPCFISVQDKNMRIVEYNRLFKEQFGATIGGYCYTVYKGRMSKCDNCAVEQTFLTGKSQKGEGTIKNLKGEEIPVYVFTSPIFNKDGEVENVLKISSDISEVKKIQKKLYETKTQLSHFFDEVPCYITIQDKDLKITKTNRQFREDFTSGGGDYCYKVYKHRDEPCLECPVAQTFKDGKSHQSEEVVTATSGNHYNVLVNTAPLRNSDGEITHVVEMSTNITQIRQLQDQLTSLGLMVSSISHGIKGISSYLDGGIYLMSSGLEKNDKERIEKGWDIVNRNVSQVRNMISDILYYAKDRELNYETVEIETFVADIISTMGSKANSYKLTFKHELSTSLDDFKIDTTAMRSAIINVLENSFDACRKDLKKPTHNVVFKIHEDSTKKNIIFDITDNGIGMDQETREKIFSLFFSSKGIGGTGLGLYISNKIITKHNGSIEVTSTIGKGTGFKITVPKCP